MSDPFRLLDSVLRDYAGEEFESDERRLITRATRVQPLWSQVEIATENLVSALLALTSLLDDLRALLEAGDLMLAEAVIGAPGRAIQTDAERRGALAARLSESGLRVAGGAVLGQERQIGRAEDKAALFASTGARAVDMESHGVARAAEAAGVPFLVARAVADPAERNLPRAALDAAGPDGRIKLFKVLTTMYLRPWEGPAMIRLAYEARLAVDTLERIAGPDGALFGGD